MKRLLLALAACVALSGTARAQSFPNWSQNYIPTDKEWRGWWARKLDTNGDGSALKWGNYTLPDLLSGKVDEVNGTSTGLNLKTPALTGGAWLDALTFGMTGAQTITAGPVGIGSRTVKSSLFVDDTVTDGTTSVWPHVIQTTSATGSGAVDPIWGGEADRINLFVGMKCLAGSSACWAENPVLYAGSGFTDGAHGVEIDIENYSSDRAPGASGVKPINGLEITGGSSYEATYGMDIVGNSSTSAAALFHDAFAVLGGAASDNSFFDVGSATESLHILGTHSIGLDLAYSTISGSAILLGSGQAINMVDTTSNKSYTMLSANSSDQIIVGANAPAVVLGDGGGGGYAFTGFTDSAAGSTTMYAAGAAANIDIDIQPKGTGALKTGVVDASSIGVSGAVTASTGNFTGTLQVPVISGAPTGACTSGQIVIDPSAMYACVAGAWKTVTLE